LFRAEFPLLIPTAAFEVDGFTPSCIFTTSLRALPEEPDNFILYYSGADTAAGAARVTVTWPLAPGAFH